MATTQNQHDTTSSTASLLILLAVIAAIGAALYLGHYWTRSPEELSPAAGTTATTGPGADHGTASTNANDTTTPDNSGTGTAPAAGSANY